MGDAPVGAILLAVVVVLCAGAGIGLLLLERRRSVAARRAAGTTDASGRAADVRTLLREAADAGNAGHAGDPGPSGLALLLFSRAGCPRCRDTREVLGLVAAEHGTVSRREVDVAARPDLVAALEVRTTPTVVVVDPAGGELLRVAGVPRREDLLAALAPHLP